MIKKRLKEWLYWLLHLKEWTETNPLEKTNVQQDTNQTPKNAEEIRSIWDLLSFRENTQAFHLKEVLTLDEWVSMDEIRRRVKELFGVEYQNDRSLYPYIKTLVDAGLLETQSSGGKMKWRKKALLVKVKIKDTIKEEPAGIQTRSVQ